MKYTIYNRFTGKVQFIAEIDCPEGAPEDLKKRLAVLWAIENKVNLRGADLSGSDLRGADLSGSDLRGVNLSGSDLSGSDLSGVDLSGADVIHCGARSDGYEFFAHIRNGEIWIKAGCRYFTIEDAKKHWKKTRGGTLLGDESLQLLKNAKALVKIRGLLEEKA